MYSILERETNALLSNLASVKSVLEVSAARPAPEDEDE
jgi:hypothetical protein